MLIVSAVLAEQELHGLQGGEGEEEPAAPGHSAQVPADHPETILRILSNHFWQMPLNAVIHD